MSAPNAPIEIRLDELVIDPSVQSRVDGLDSDYVALLEATPEAWPPILVVPSGKKYRVVDGFGRVAAAQNLNLKTVLARVVEPPEDGDLRGLNFASNLAHGLRPTRADQRAECERLLLLHPEWSDREVGRRCQFSQPTVAKVRDELERSAQLSTPQVRVGRGGYRYTPSRRAGELPSEGLGEQAVAIGARLFSGPERARQRGIAGYLRRVATSLDERGDLLDDPAVAAEAVHLVLGDERAEDLAADLGDAAIEIHAVALALGYDSNAES